MSSETDALGLLGTTILEKYAIESVVGQGGFATVYRATHLLWKRPVAIKVFSALGEVRAVDREKLLADFIQEGALLAQLSEASTAILQARDVGMLTLAKGQSVPYMVLEWLDGQTLEECLTQEKGHRPPRSFGEALQLLEPVGEALALAHKKGIVHRDVKPANIFVLRDGGVKLLDFGIAKVVQDAQRGGFGATAGHITSFTPNYGAPEQFNRAYGATGPWTDVFALALVISEVVSGQEPLGGDTLVQLAFASTNPTRRPTPRALGVATSDEVEAVFARALAVNVTDRFQTVGDFWAALRWAFPAERPAFRSDPSLVMSAAGPTAPPPPPGSGPRFVSATTSPVSPVSPTQPLPPGGTSSKTPLVMGLVGAFLGVAVGATVYVVKSRGKDAITTVDAAASATAVASAPSSASAASASAPPASACPAGMIAIPGGEFFMGSEEKDAFDFEKPVHKVKVASFCLDAFEVTVAKYKACSDVGGCRRASRENDWPGITAAQKKAYDPLCNIRDPDARASHPINCVEWDYARAYCEKQGGRLPTEAEWEFAARGSDGRIYPWGDEPPSAELLNACGKECVDWKKKHADPSDGLDMMYDASDGFPATAPVGSFPKGKSRYGIQDVVGNVWEWVDDYYADYTADPATDPKGPPTGKHRVIRGGGWNGTRPSWVRPSFRFHDDPAARSHGYGFRCARTL